MDKKIKAKLIKKIEKDGGDISFADEIKNILNTENNKAEDSKKSYFRIEKWIIIISALSSVMAGLTGMEIFGYESKLPICIVFLPKLLAVVLPATVTALVAYRGVKRNLETWIRHRKYSMEIRLLIDKYVYEYGKFQKVKGEKSYRLFCNKMHFLFTESKREFLKNMSK